VLVSAAVFQDLVLAVHILGVVVGFGVTFAYPIFFRVGSRLEPGAMPWFFRMMQLLTRQLVYPGLLIVLVCGIYLASQKHQFSAFYVQWGFFAVVAIGALEGGLIAPRVRKLIVVSQRELAAAPVAGAGPSSAFSFSGDYRAVFNQLSIAGAAQSLIVILTVFFMATHAGA